MRTLLVCLIIGCAVVGFAVSPALAEGRGAQQTLAEQLGFANQGAAPNDVTPFETFLHAVGRLPLAAALGAALAFRPRRRGTPARKAPVIQTQIILAIVGAVVMLVVGASLARAFGVVGVASLIRYRSKIDDPKDAGVMLSCLAIGLASGVGLYLLAIFAAAFVLAALWVIESLEPEATREFSLTIKTKQPDKLRPQIEEILRRSRFEHDLRTSANDEVSYQVKLPVARKTERVTQAIMKLGDAKDAAVEWDEKKDKK